jgi:hypothetical protein
MAHESPACCNVAIRSIRREAGRRSDGGVRDDSSRGSRRDRNREPDRGHPRRCRIVRRAHAEGAARVGELTREPQRLRDDAAADAERTRKTGEDQSRAAIAKAEHDALSIKGAAEAEAHRIEADGQRRVQELAREAETLVHVREGAARDVREAIRTLRQIADQLELQLLARVGTSAIDSVEPHRWRRRLRRDTASVDRALLGGGTPSEDMHARAKELGSSSESSETALVESRANDGNGEGR